MIRPGSAARPAHSKAPGSRTRPTDRGSVPNTWARRATLRCARPPCRKPPRWRAPPCPVPIGYRAMGSRGVFASSSAMTERFASRSPSRRGLPICPAVSAGWSRFVEGGVRSKAGDDEGDGSLGWRRRSRSLKEAYPPSAMATISRLGCQRLTDNGSCQAHSVIFLCRLPRALQRNARSGPERSRTARPKPPRGPRGLCQRGHARPSETAGFDEVLVAGA